MLRVHMASSNYDGIDVYEISKTNLQKVFCDS